MIVTAVECVQADNELAVRLDHNVLQHFRVRIIRKISHEVEVVGDHAIGAEGGIH